MADESDLDVELSESRNRIFEKITKNETEDFKQLIAQLRGGVNFTDENGMTPLQHACCKGNLDVVKVLMDMGADVNYSKHGANYTPLHFAALSGNTQICHLLLDAGVNPNAINSISRTASQMAAFVGNHACVETINNYVQRTELEYYIRPHGQQTKPYLEPDILDNFHKFIIEINLHPVRIVLNLQALNLLKHLPNLKRVIELMCEKEMKKSHELNEVMAFKYHYLSWVVSELLRCEEQCKAQRKGKADHEAGKHDYVELFIKRVLKENKLAQLDYVEYMVRDCAREFPFRECTIFRQIVSHLASKDPPPALTILRNAINGQKGFTDDIFLCSTCGKEKPDKKCSKCKAVQYCDRECQRLHWFMHKKSCARPTSNVSSSSSSSIVAPRVAKAAPAAIDVNEVREEMAKMVTS